jgi:NAD(P)-dependent dehydrogenase (short-subunit alcohol dehydrogenase family)
MRRLEGKTALITGGTTGIGRATAELFIEHGARVAITGQDAQRVADAARALGPQAIGIRADVSRASDMDELARRLKAEFGELDIVFANAGVAHPRPLAEVDQQHIDLQFGVNVTGVILTVQKVLPLLRKPASIVLTGSTVAEQGMAGMSVYSATKAAVRSLARTLSAELAPRGVRVNVVSPGPIETPIFGKMGLPDSAVQAWGDEIIAKNPMGRFGQPIEIAKAVLFLASDDSSYMLGENILVDGGAATV